MTLLGRMAPEASCAIAVTLVGLLATGCSMENPAYDELGDGKTEAGTHGTGDGDSPTTDDLPTGDDEAGSTTTGDGDDDGDGDGDEICPDGQVSCNGACATLASDPQNCGVCGKVCSNVEICGLDQCRAKKYVFVTSTRYQGDVGAVASPDGICQQRAMDAGLPGVYRAWMASANVPLDLSPGGAYVLPNGPVVAWSWPGLISGELLAPINRTEFGDAIAPSPAESCGLDYAVWTGTTHAGAALPDNCEGWQSNDSTLVGRVGNAKASDPTWSASECKATCSAELPLYCVAQ